MTAEALRVERLCVAYGKADVLEDVSLTVEPGQITCLLGSNGSGKTSLIRAILGLVPARTGKIFFGNVQLSKLPTHRIVAQGISCIPEGRRLFPRLTVEENLVLGAFREPTRAIVAQRLDEVLTRLPVLRDRRAQIAGTLSGGEQAMVSIGRGLMGAPRILLVDEPSLGLSPRLVKESFAILSSIHQQGIALFLVEQNVHQTLAIAHRGYVLSKGRVVAQGTAAELSRDPTVAQAYFGAGGQP